MISFKLCFVEICMTMLDCRVSLLLWVRLHPLLLNSKLRYQALTHAFFGTLLGTFIVPMNWQCPTVITAAVLAISQCKACGAVCLHMFSGQEISRNNCPERCSVCCPSLSGSPHSLPPQKDNERVCSKWRFVRYLNGYDSDTDWLYQWHLCVSKHSLCPTLLD